MAHVGSVQSHAFLLIIVSIFAHVLFPYCFGTVAYKISIIPLPIDYCSISISTTGNLLNALSIRGILYAVKILSV